MKMKLAALAALLSAAPFAAHAAKPNSPLSGVNTRAVAAANAAADKTTAPAILLSTTISAGGESEMAVNGGFVALDTPKTIVCPGPKVCRIEAEQHVQVGQNSTASNL